ncbi:16S rRNA (uracil(1498)-N(3))-methyltransferase [Buchnera aphidicola]|uniref:RsmE family RNA methyltransferase n=1 Tax=Buchnera aphidicola TaxID=9 RepID=UPI003463A230
MFLATIQFISKELIALKIINCTSENNESNLYLHLGQIISKNKNMDMIIQKSVELGVSKITPIFNKLLKNILNKDYIYKKMKHWKEIIISSCQQCERNIVPEIDEPQCLKKWIKEDKKEKKFFFEKSGKYSINNLDQNINKVRILIGSEYGFSKKDKMYLLKNGFSSLSLGSRTLRMETAAISAISCLQLKFGDF